MEYFNPKQVLNTFSPELKHDFYYGLGLLVELKERADPQQETLINDMLRRLGSTINIPEGL